MAAAVSSKSPVGFYGVCNSLKGFYSTIKPSIKKVNDFVMPVIIGLGIALASMWLMEVTFALGILIGFKWSQGTMQKCDRIKQIWTEQLSFLAKGAIVLVSVFLLPYVKVVVPFAAGAYLVASALEKRHLFIDGWL